MDSRVPEAEGKQMNNLYFKQRYAQGYWRIGLKVIDAHTIPDHGMWLRFRAFGGATPSKAEHCFVSDRFRSEECRRVTFRKLPRSWRNRFKAERP